MKLGRYDYLCLRMPGKKFDLDRRPFDLRGRYKICYSVQCNAFGPHDKTCKVLLSGCLMAKSFFESSITISSTRKMNLEQATNDG